MQRNIVGAEADCNKLTHSVWAWMVEREGTGPLLGGRGLPGLCARGASLVLSQQVRSRNPSSEKDPSESFGLPAKGSGGLVSYTKQKRTEMVPVGL